VGKRFQQGASQRDRKFQAASEMFDRLHEQEAKRAAENLADAESVQQQSKEETENES
jgi:hypothetical protein